MSEAPQALFERLLLSAVRPKYDATALLVSTLFVWVLSFFFAVRIFLVKYARVFSLCACRGGG